MSLDGTGLAAAESSARKRSKFLLVSIFITLPAVSQAVSYNANIYNFPLE